MNFNQQKGSSSLCHTVQNAIWNLWRVSPYAPTAAVPLWNPGTVSYTHLPPLPGRCICFFSTVPWPVPPFLSFLRSVRKFCSAKAPHTSGPCSCVWRPQSFFIFPRKIHFMYWHPMKNPTWLPSFLSKHSTQESRRIQFWKRLLISFSVRNKASRFVRPVAFLTFSFTVWFREILI